MTKINYSPVLTANNFGINYAEINDDILCTFNKTFNNVKITKQDTFTLKNAIMPQNSSTLLGKNEQTPNFSKCIEIKKSTKTPIVLEFNFDKNNNYLNDYLEIELKQNTSASVIIKYVGKANGFSCTTLKINLQKNANLDLTIFSNNGCNNLLKIIDEKKEKSKIAYHLIDFTSMHTIHSLHSSECSAQTQTKIDSMFVADKNAFMDINYLVELSHEKGTATLSTIGAINDEAQKHYKGTIKFNKGAKKSTGVEKEFCLMLSKNARSKSLPMILCEEEDVSGSHATSAGKVNENDLFYIMSRGLNKEQATKLLVLAKFEQIIKTIGYTPLKEEILEELNRRLK